MAESDVLVRAFDAGRVAGVVPVAPRIDTHISHVFLTADRAIKLKRAVRLPFVDFSTVALRRRACEAEFAINRRMGSKLHLGVRPVVAVDGGYRIGGNGEPIDWVVEMRRFDQSQQFDVMARDGRLSIALIEATAHRLAEVHARLDAERDPAHATDYAGVIDGLRATEADGMRRFGLAGSDATAFEALHAARERLMPVVGRRCVDGRVRRGHGDLHLRNLCLFEGDVTLFDALEFDDRMATADVLYDLAFLLMDLRLRALDAHANRAMNCYWDAAGEEEYALALLPFFTALRATVRMAVATESGDGSEADAYRRLAGALLVPSVPRVIAIGGLSGVGKSAVARALAACLPGPAGARLLRSDVLRKAPKPGGALAGVLPDEAYSDVARLQVYEQLAKRVGEASAAGATVIADATFQQPQARAMFGAGVRGFWLDAPLALRLERIAARRDDASDANVAVARAQCDPGPLGVGWQRIDARGPVEAVRDRILRALA